MRRIAVLIQERYDRLMPELEAVRDTLAARGVDLRFHDFLDYSAPLPEADGYLLQALSGYYTQHAAFVTLLQRLDATGKPVMNNTRLAHWNSDKRYLHVLEKEGIATLPTLWANRLERELIDKAAERGWDYVIAKPAISAGAFHTIKLHSSDRELWRRHVAEAPYESAVMMQPFAQEIVDEGEWSFLFFGGRFSHCILKTAKSGDYRIQHVHGGDYTRQEPPAALLRDAEKVIATLPEPTTYARVDGIRRGGRLLLMEVEVIEPFLYLLPDEAAVARYADALVEGLG